MMVTSSIAITSVAIISGSHRGDIGGIEGCRDHMRMLHGYF